MRSNPCLSGQNLSQQTDHNPIAVSLWSPNWELEYKSPSTCIAFLPQRQLAVLICPSRTETVLCYLLSQNSSLFKLMTTTNHRVFFLHHLTWFCPSLFPHPMLLIPPAAFISSFNRGKNWQWIHILFHATWHSGEIPRDAVLQLPGEVPRCSTARKSLDLYCRKSLS